ncbi:hypothetical protein BN000_02181 [Mycobacterium europaeum]|uniref:Uncharacterized protein n=1 Tax=Mycobacterium europaeum TaxID=761804 RepID=A0A0U1D993_9MYCO|nr:hypothetical protein BN000_02181 [Mycobacterium europaeum]
MGKHDKDVNAVVEEITAHDWVEVTGRKGYRKFRCPCGSHQKTIHKSPSDPNYFRNLRGWFHRQSCWKEGETR